MHRPLPADAAPLAIRLTPRLLRTGLLAVLLFGIAGLGAELLLLEHWEGGWQIAPLALLGAAVATLALDRARPGPLATAALRATMLLLVVSGAVGFGLHLRGNLEWELESQPSLGGWPLFWEALRGATPALAPGAMAQIGLLGLLYAGWRPASDSGNPLSSLHAPTTDS